MKVEDLGRAQQLAELRKARLEDRTRLVSSGIFDVTVTMRDNSAVHFRPDAQTRMAHLTEAAAEELLSFLVDKLNRAIASYEVDLEELGVELPDEAIVLRVVQEGE